MSDIELEEHFRKVYAFCEQIIALLTKQSDIAAFGGSISTPVKQQGDRQMPGPVTKLSTNLTQAMFDDQTATYTPSPTNAQGAAEAFAPGTAPTYVAVPGTAVTLVPATDGSGSLVVNGVKGQAGTEVITGNYTNPDGTAADPVTLTFTQSVDPAEADVKSFGGSISTPVAQTPAASSSKRP